MAFDGRYYAGAAPIPPVLHHSRAPAVGDLCAQALRAGYFYSQHQASVIGVQTWPLRQRRYAPGQYLAVSSFQRIAEWCAVHLASHHERVVARLTVGASAVQDAVNMTLKAKVVVGANTDEAQEVVSCTADRLEGYVQGLAIFSVDVAVPLSTVVRPTESALVYLEAYAVASGEGVAAQLRPMTAQAWRLAT